MNQGSASQILLSLGWKYKLPQGNRYSVACFYIFCVIALLTILIMIEFAAWSLIGFWIHLGIIADPLLEIFGY